MKKPRLHQSELDEPKICGLCFGAGMEVVKGKGARPCICRQRERLNAAREQSLLSVPPRFQNINLDSLQADPTRHKNQQTAIDLIRSNPHKNFAIFGTFGSGKTHLLYSIFQTVIETKFAYASTLEEIISEHKTRFEADKKGNPVKSLSITPEHLTRKNTPFGLFIDDIDKETPTEFVCKIFFALVNAAYDNHQQVVFTTNLTPAGLIEHFKKADPRYGGAISRRLLSESLFIKLF